MSTLKETITHWRDKAEVDWFSQFIKAWIPFNAWLTHTYGDLKDSELLDRVKAPGNSVYNGIVPRLDPERTRGQDDLEFRLQMAELHRLLEATEIKGRRGRISFTRVDIGANPHKDEQQKAWKRDFRVRRDHPSKDSVTLEITATKSTDPFCLTVAAHDWMLIEHVPAFVALELTHKSRLRVMFDSVSPRKIQNVLQSPGTVGAYKFGTTEFVSDAAKLFSALIDVLYGLRNALFHGSITPTEEMNEIYGQAYQIVMRLVRCTV